MSIEAMKRIKSWLQDTKMIDSHTVSAVVAECDAVILTQQPATGEPVAQWQKRHPVRTGGRWISTDEHDAKWWSERATGWEARALYTHPAPSVPDGYALVRIEPTVGMLIAGAESRISQEQPTREHAVWAAMLADK